jgi:hypothetical protein
VTPETTLINGTSQFGAAWLKLEMARRVVSAITVLNIVPPDSVVAKK